MSSELQNKTNSIAVYIYFGGRINRPECIYALLTKREVKMAGFWPSHVLFCVFMYRDEVEVHKNANKLGQ